VDSPAGSPVNVLPGVDVRGNGAQVVIPPSTHKNGVKYAWEVAPWDVELAPPPDWLVNLIKKGQRVSNKSKSNGKGKGNENLPVLIEGSRDNTIFKEALRMAESGLSEDDIVAVCIAWCNRDGHFDMVESGEVKKTVGSAVITHYKNVATLSDFGNLLSWQDTDNADRFAKYVNGNAIYVVGRGWYVWDGRRWEEQGKEIPAVRRLAEESVKAAKSELLEKMKGKRTTREMIVALNQANSSQSVARMTAFINHATCKLELIVNPDQLNLPSSATLVNFLNGTLDLSTGMMRPHSRADMLTTIIEHNYNPSAECPFWGKRVGARLSERRGNARLLSARAGLLSFGKGRRKKDLSVYRASPWPWSQREKHDAQRTSAYTRA